MFLPAESFSGQIIYRPSLQFTTVTSRLVIFLIFFFTKGAIFFPPSYSIVIHYSTPNTHTSPRIYNDLLALAKGWGGGGDVGAGPMR